MQANEGIAWQLTRESQGAGGEDGESEDGEQDGEHDHACQSITRVCPSD